MASSFFALLDDIATVLDDISVMTKVAAKKTSGVLGDDLALNAKQVSGVSAERELPVVLAVAKGSAINKVILVPAALLISGIAPWLINPLLMFGGAYLCFEGCEKILHSFFHKKSDLNKEHKEHLSHLQKSDKELLDLEKEKIKGAVKTDFILSAEIIVIALGTATQASLMKQFLMLFFISVGMTVGVYGLVAVIIKLDDLGLWLQRKKRGFQQLLGAWILWACPWLMRTLSIVGTLAMFLVGGGIINHGIPAIHHGIEHVSELAGAFKVPVSLLIEAVLGFLYGGVIVFALKLLQKLRKK